MKSITWGVSFAPSRACAHSILHSRGFPSVPHRSSVIALTFSLQQLQNKQERGHSKPNAAAQHSLGATYLRPRSKTTQCCVTPVEYGATQSPRPTPVPGRATRLEATWPVWGDCAEANATVACSVLGAAMGAVPLRGLGALCRPSFAPNPKAARESRLIRLRGLPATPTLPCCAAARRARAGVGRLGFAGNGDPRFGEVRTALAAGRTTNASPDEPCCASEGEAILASASRSAFSCRSSSSA